MSDNSVTIQNYINNEMSKLPDVSAKKEYQLKSGESLWGIAKKELGNPNASNRDIQEYMLLIAKLNGLNTVEKMNGLHINDKIYLPAEPQKIANTKPNNHQKTSLDETVTNLIDILQNDKTTVVQRAALSLPKEKVFHIFRNKKLPNGFTSPLSPVLSFTLNKNDEIINLSINDVNDILKLKYDYMVDAEGKTRLRQIPYTAIGQITPEDKEVLFGEIKKLYEEYKNKYMIN